MSFQQAQQAEEERRQQEDAVHPDCEDRCQIAEHKGYRSCQFIGIPCAALESGRRYVKGVHPASWITYLPSCSGYDGRADMAPDGRNIGYWNRNIIAPQMQVNLDRAANKERK